MVVLINCMFIRNQCRFVAVLVEQTFWQAGCFRQC